MSKDLDRPVSIKPNLDYFCFTFHGVADGTPLTPGFDLENIRNRFIILKSFRIIPYYAPVEEPGNQPVDIFLNDGVTQTVEVVQPLSRINRLFDTYNNNCHINFRINSSPVTIFQSQVITNPGYPLDLWIDGINFKYLSRLQSIDLSIWGNVVDNLQTAQETNPLIKVVIECYLE